MIPRIVVVGNTYMKRKEKMFLSPETRIGFDGSWSFIVPLYAVVIPVVGESAIRSMREHYPE